MDREAVRVEGWEADDAAVPRDAEIETIASWAGDGDDCRPRGVRRRFHVDRTDHFRLQELQPDLRVVVVEVGNPGILRTVDEVLGAEAREAPEPRAGRHLDLPEGGRELLDEGLEISVGQGQDRAGQRGSRDCSGKVDGAAHVRIISRDKAQRQIGIRHGASERDHRALSSLAGERGDLVARNPHVLLEVHTRNADVRDASAVDDSSRRLRARRFHHVKSDSQVETASGCDRQLDRGLLRRAEPGTLSRDLS